MTTVKDRLVGTWKLLPWNDHKKDGEFPLNENSVGYIIYTADGYMTAQLMELGRDGCDGPGNTHCTAEEYTAMGRGFLSYAGKYTLNEAEHSITHHVDVAFNPWFVGTDQVRYYSFPEDNLLLLEAVFNGKSAYIAWQRAEPNL